ncbi:mechanosensitive ion channel domain-containing protein [Wenzhouxiangella sp. EGI_FJ10409]|uniref:mechanosensitive ion channel domain-containing protein n=1 Tax=Wenzhouxiangella sp. EGI_FJ10409 TaxID=3243767 RepID=UPI0035E148B7
MAATQVLGSAQTEMEEHPEPPGAVDIEPEASDEAIAARLQRILVATGWYEQPAVTVDEGVAFLYGEVRRPAHRQWAGDLARSTQDVVAVVNNVQFIEPAIWDLGPALSGLNQLGRTVLRSLPYVLFSLLILVLAWHLGALVTRLLRWFTRNREKNMLLTDVFARGGGVLVLLAGLYSVFHVAGLTNVALAILGGTGLAGIALGIAFRDITENFLASLFLSAQNPFRTGDLIEVGNTRGFVQSMTTRVTVLMTQNGNHVQIPNATIYKSDITNFSANPNERMEFGVVIGLNDSISATQEIGLAVVSGHPSVLVDPEPWVFAEEIRNAAVLIKVSFWFDSRKTNGLQLRSSLIRLTKRALMEAGMTIQAEQRQLVEQQAVDHAEESAEAMTPSEAVIRPEGEVIRNQAALAPTPEKGENLLDR